MPAIPISRLQGIVSPQKAQSIADSVFGPKPAEPTEAERLASIRDQKFTDWLNSRKQEIEQQRTDAVKMARFNALGNVLTTMVQPLGWTAGGVTGGVQPYDNRQYLDAFNRAIKASDDLRNIGTLEGEYQFKLAEDAYQRQMAFDAFKQKQDYEAQLNDAYASAQHERRMEEIAARGDVQMQVAQIRASRVTKDGKPVTGDNLKTAYTQWYRYLGRYWDDIGRGVERKEKNGPLSLAEFLSSPEGGGYKVESGDTTKTTSTASPAPAAKPEKKGGFQTSGNSASGKKGGFQI